MSRPHQEKNQQMQMFRRGERVAVPIPPAVGRGCSTQAHKNTIIICSVVSLAHWTVNFRAQMAFPSSVAAPAPHNGLDAGETTQRMESESNKGPHTADPAVGSILSWPRGDLESFLLSWSWDLGF